jgi:uncharacterized protein GlcG (DUF336 family)
MRPAQCPHCKGSVSCTRAINLAQLCVTPLEVGIPIVVNGQIIGAIGVIGLTSAQEAQVAAAGIQALAK